MKRVSIAIALLLLFGAARLPMEIHLQKEQQAAGFNSVSPRTLRQKVGQQGFIAALSGFRSLVAAVLWLEAQDAWEKIEWGRMDGIFQTVTTLQPKSPLYWDMSAWHMAWNAAHAALEDEKKQPSKILRERDERHYWERGRQYYEEGMRNNPDSALLAGNLGVLERDKFEDHAAAAKAFDIAASKEVTRPYWKRAAAYEIAKIPGREREAYDRLKSYYDQSEKERLPAVIATIKRLEEKLGIPADQRIKEDKVQ
ncbi:MAG: hypothetical protein ACREKL_13410 [Chthoniobacterales bacterium]